VQAQAHVQLVSKILDSELDSQAAVDAPRFRIDGKTVWLEEGLWDYAGVIRRAGYQVACAQDSSMFGVGQAILVREDTLCGGSDSRADGYAAGL
jgi:gamma-glutamyltranspeptidase/glutathione hydrolase